MKPLANCGHAGVSATNYDCKVHTRVSVLCPAASIGLSSNDSGPDPVGTTFLFTESLRSTVQLPTSLLPFCKPEAATPSDSVRSICFSPLEPTVGRSTPLYLQGGCQIGFATQSAVVGNLLLTFCLDVLGGLGLLDDALDHGMHRSGRFGVALSFDHMETIRPLVGTTWHREQNAFSVVGICNPSRIR